MLKRVEWNSNNNTKKVKNIFDYQSIWSSRWAAELHASITGARPKTNVDAGDNPNWTIPGCDVAYD